MVVAYSKKPLVGIIMGSSSDSRIMKGAAEIFDEFKIKHEDQIISAHRTLPDYLSMLNMLKKWVLKLYCRSRWGSSFTWNDASHTTIPVIGVSNFSL